MHGTVKSLAALHERIKNQINEKLSLSGRVETCLGLFSSRTIESHLKKDRFTRPTGIGKKIDAYQHLGGAKYQLEGTSLGRTNGTLANKLNKTENISSVVSKIGSLRKQAIKLDKNDEYSKTTRMTI